MAPGKLAGIAGPMNVDLAYSNDGSLLTATTWSGDVEGVVSFGYDNNYQNGGSYYCDEAPYWCDFFGTNPWANCTRACLQSCDASRNPRNDNFSPDYDYDEELCPSLAPEEPDNSDPWNMLDPSTDMTQCHVTCYAACWGVTVTGGP